MHSADRWVVGFWWVVGLPVLAFPPVAGAQPARAGLKDVSKLRKQLQSTSDVVRSNALRTLSSRIRSDKQAG
jgi:hypothetical protein